MKILTIKDVDAAADTVRLLTTKLNLSGNVLTFFLSPLIAPQPADIGNDVADELRSVEAQERIGGASGQVANLVAGMALLVCCDQWHKIVLEGIDSATAEEPFTLDEARDMFADFALEAVREGANANLDGFGKLFNDTVINKAAEIVWLRDRQIEGYETTCRLAAKYGIDMVAVDNTDPVALKSLAQATINEMTPDKLQMFVIINGESLEKLANDTAEKTPFPGMLLEAAKARLATFDTPEAEGAGGFVPAFSGAVEEDAVRA